MSDFGMFNGFSRPYVIAGPCSAESEDQIMRTALALHEQGISFFRAGVWKPRSHPDSFDGAGEIALGWLQRVRKELGMKTATEVANAEHVEKALNHGVDILWIGARTTTNPFMVQEIISSLEGVDIPILVKNPVTPDLQLWAGALERFLKAGITRLSAVHRGFFFSEENKYRNSPGWYIPIELKRLYPEIPLLCDPSHIAGNREYIRELSQRAMDLNFDGLMIETHIDPDNALSDKEQQVSPQELADILSSLKLKTPGACISSETQELNSMRARIDEIDEAIVRLISKRADLAEQIGRYKREHDISVLQYDRWEEVLSKVLALGDQSALDRNLLSQIYSILHEMSIGRQI